MSCQADACCAVATLVQLTAPATGAKNRPAALWHPVCRAEEGHIVGQAAKDQASAAHHNQLLVQDPFAVRWGLESKLSHVSLPAKVTSSEQRESFFGGLWLVASAAHWVPWHRGCETKGPNAYLVPLHL